MYKAFVVVHTSDIDLSSHRKSDHAWRSQEFYPGVLARRGCGDGACNHRIPGSGVDGPEATGARSHWRAPP